MALKTETFAINIGPAHMSTHGVFRMRAIMDGEVIVDMEPVFGYLHRGIEKLAEQRTYTGIIPLTDRIDYTSQMSNNLAHCLAVEKLADIKVPERAEYFRSNYGRAYSESVVISWVSALLPMIAEPWVLPCSTCSGRERKFSIFSKWPAVRG